MSPEIIPRRSWTAIYTRQSRSSNVEFSSCEAQLSECLKFVMARLGDGWVWNGKRYDDEGQSSETLDRLGLQKFLKDMREGKIDRVVVYRLDRLSRCIAHCAALPQELKEHQIPLTIVANPELEFMAEHTLILNLMASFAEFEQEMTRERLAESRAAMKRHGLRVAGAVPYGYKTDGRSKQLLVDRSESLHVRRMFQMAAEVTTPAGITKIANHRGWRTKQWLSKSGNRRGGNRWTPRQILATLSNPIYVGQIHNGDGTRPGKHKAIVSGELFQQVAVIIQLRRSRPPSRKKLKTLWPLQGLLKCGQCGRLMSPSRSGHGNIIYRYYRCRSHAGGRPPCASASVPALEIERYVLNTISSPDVHNQLPVGMHQALTSVWSAMKENEKYRLIPELVQEATFHEKRGAISVKINTTAIQRIMGAGSQTLD
jgi:site-specific DNA recombinase